MGGGVYSLLDKNRRYRNTHTGERCFILGNGPSLRDIDLSSLSNEFVFTVNNFSQVKNYRQAHTNVHLWIDFAFFGLRQDMTFNMDKVMANYYAIAKENPVCFVPFNARDFIMRNNLDKILNLNYLLITQPLSYPQNIQYDIHGDITSFTTVVQYAVIVAVYMGFKEIYLLGCDSTNIVSLVNGAVGVESTGMHAYDNDDNTKLSRMILDSWKMSDILWDQYLLFKGYKVLNEFSSSKGIKFINCSTKTIVNEVPRMRLEEVLQRRTAS